MTLNFQQSFGKLILHQMSSLSHLKLISECWYRILFSSLLIEDVSQLILNFLAQFESFDMSSVDSNVCIQDNDTILTKEPNSGGSSSAFGTIIVTDGCLYHWKIEIMDTPWSESFNNTMKGEIGIVEADKCMDKNKLNYWWCKSWYFCNDLSGTAYNGTSSVNYGNGEKYRVNDIVHVLVDLKDKYSISWGKNDKMYEQFELKLKPKTDYKLAVRLYHGKIKLVSFETEY